MTAKKKIIGIPQCPRNPNIGLSAKDVITGVKGYITSYCQCITGCDQYRITPKGTEKGKWVDCNRLEILTTKKLILDTKEAKGSMGEPPIK